MVPAIERGFPQREIQESSYGFAKAVDRKEKIIVGLNEFVTERQPPIDLLIIDDSVQQRQWNRLKQLRNGRNHGLVAGGLSALKRAAGGKDNLMPFILDCVRSYATLGEICDALRAVFGEYQEPNIF
jgi:methylmalonyl-CoA mutase N-terminal domain/subunit